MSDSSIPYQSLLRVDETDKELIKKLWSRYSVEDIAKTLGYNPATISKWAKRMGLDRKTSGYKRRYTTHPRYSEYEDAFIRENADKLNAREIANKLGRSYHGIKNRARQLKIPLTKCHKKPHERLNADELAWLKKNFADCNNKFICMRLGIGTTTLGKLKLKYNLSKSEEYKRQLASWLGKKSYEAALKDGRMKPGELPSQLLPYKDQKGKKRKL